MIFLIRGHNLKSMATIYNSPTVIPTYHDNNHTVDALDIFDMLPRFIIRGHDL